MIPADRLSASTEPKGRQWLPRLRHDLDVLPDAGDGYVLHDPQSGREFKIGRWERVVVQMLDGSRRLDDVCRELMVCHRLRCDPSVLGRFVEELRGAGLLASGGNADPHPAALERRGLLYMIRLARPDELARRATAWLPWLGHPLVLMGAFGLVTSAVVITATHSGEMGALIAQAWTAPTAVAALCLAVLAGLAHEASHALAARWFGARLVSAGVGVYYFRPCLFCEIRGLESLARSKRLVVDGAGLALDLIQASAGVVLWWLLPAEFPGEVLLLTAALLGLRVAINLNPLLKLDGYYLLVDLIERRDLREAAFRALARTLRSLPSLLSRRGASLKPPPLGEIVYSLLAIGYAIVVVGAAFVALERWLRPAFDGADLIVATVIVFALAGLTDDSLRRGARHLRSVR